jgi:hypothetical protein
MNDFVRRNLGMLERAGVLIRIASFTAVAWLGERSPILLVWTVNTADALLLSWCSALKRDRAYLLLNVFWVVVVPPPHNFLGHLIGVKTLVIERGGGLLGLGARFTIIVC